MACSTIYIITIILIIIIIIIDHHHHYQCKISHHCNYIVTSCHHHQQKKQPFLYQFCCAVMQTSMSLEAKVWNISCNDNVAVRTEPLP